MSTIRVLVVDDSAFARKVLREVLANDPEIEVVGIARDGIEALERIEALRPDVVTLDLMMPDLDGLGVLRALPRATAPRIVVVSVSPADSDRALDALALGAVGLVEKPTAFATDRLYGLAEDLRTEVKAAAVARPALMPQLGSPHAQSRPTAPSDAVASDVELVLIGTSTGGPQALTHVFSTLPANFPVPIAMALHIPPGYTQPLAERLSKLGGPQVLEAIDGMEFVPGQALLAPGGMHLSVEPSRQGLSARVTREPLTTQHHPSVDVLFESAAVHAGAAVVAVVLTGMGDDGVRGARAIRERGGQVLTEAESSCVVYGMPRSVEEAGLSDGRAPLADIVPLLISRLRQGHDDAE